MSTSRILLIEDDHQIRQMLRSVLALLVTDCEVVDVISAEEALLEVQRAPFDLVVTDVRLAGMGGLELMERVRKSRPAGGLIVITGNDSPEVQAQAKELNASAFFVKPIDTDALVKAVQEALGRSQQESSEEEGEAADSEQEAGLEEEPSVPGIADLIIDLREHLEALSVYLADLNGQVMVSAGDVTGLELKVILGRIAAALSATFRVNTLLGQQQPRNVYFFDGQDFDVFVINVGKEFLMLMIFEGNSDQQQVARVWELGRACATSLEEMLTSMDAGGATAAQTAVTAALRASEPSPVIEVPMPLSEDEEESFPEEEAIELDLEALDSAAEQAKETDADAFWETAITEANLTDVDAKGLSFEQAKKLGLAPDEED